MSALDSVLGYPGDPVACRKVGEVSMHWYPTGEWYAEATCLCGEQTQIHECCCGQPDCRDFEKSMAERGIPLDDLERVEVSMPLRPGSLSS